MAERLAATAAREVNTVDEQTQEARRQLARMAEREKAATAALLQRENLELLERLEHTPAKASVALESEVESARKVLNNLNLTQKPQPPP